MNPFSFVLQVVCGFGVGCLLLQPDKLLSTQVKWPHEVALIEHYEHENSSSGDKKPTTPKDDENISFFKNRRVWGMYGGFVVLAPQTKRRSSTAARVENSTIVE